MPAVEDRDRKQVQQAHRRGQDRDETQMKLSDASGWLPQPEVSGDADWGPSCQVPRRRSHRWIHSATKGPDKELRTT